MLHFHVDALTCGGCAARVTRAVQAADPGARVEVDVATRRVAIAPAAADAAALQAAMAAAGYPATRVEGAAPAPARAGCCCAARRAAAATSA